MQYDKNNYCRDSLYENPCEGLYSLFHSI
jgi:hypothetical protein